MTALSVTTQETSSGSALVYEGVRGAAIRILTRLERSDSYLEKLLESEWKIGEYTPHDRALLVEIVYGTLRWQAKLDWILTGFYHGEFDKCLTPVKNAMRVALHQILHMEHVQPQAAIAESVATITRIKGDRPAGVVYGVLKNILRHTKDIRYPNYDDDPMWHYSVVYSHPRWLVKRWVERFGEAAAVGIFSANNRRPLVTLRTNLLRTTLDEIKNWLESNGISYSISQIHPQSFTVNSLHEVISGAPFAAGWFDILDVGASLVVQLAAPLPGQHVIDLCAGTGGKSWAIAEAMNNEGNILALERYRDKLRPIEAAANRLGARLRTAEGDPRNFAPSTTADLVVLDAPCSELGMLAIKPDIKWKRIQDDIPKFVHLQQQMLDNASTMVKPGGALIYCTCTTESEENQQNAQWFLEQHPDFRLDDAENYLPAAVCSDGFLMALPHRHGTAGTFAARFVKKA